MDAAGGRIHQTGKPPSEQGSEGDPIRSKRSGVRPESRLVHGVAAGDGAHDRDILDLVGINGMRIVREGNKVGELAGGDRAFDALLE